jgi:hypothetical protein
MELETASLIEQDTTTNFPFNTLMSVQFWKCIAFAIGEKRKNLSFKKIEKGIKDDEGDDR